MRLSGIKATHSKYMHTAGGGFEDGDGRARSSPYNAHSHQSKSGSLYASVTAKVSTTTLSDLCK